ncbi:MAG: hypothetical protein K6T88_00580 [Bacillus sp. (in: Bacteria)]|nr:hypothetical protein [Bacillus sp. (in: firmicutes)]
MNTEMYGMPANIDAHYRMINQADERILPGFGRPGFGFGRPFGFRRPFGFGLGFGLPFLGGLAAGALLSAPYGYGYPYYPYPYPYPYPPYPYYPWY